MCWCFLFLKKYYYNIENQYIYFIDKTDRHDYSSDVYHIIKWLASVDNVFRVSECVQKFYDLTNVMQQKDKVRSVKFDTDIYNTLEKW